EIDAAKTVRMSEFNVQNQQKIEWPRNLIVAKAYVDQLERTQALPADRITALRTAIQKGDSGNLKKMAPAVEKDATSAKSAADANRLKSLAEILNSPTSKRRT